MRLCLVLAALGVGNAWAPVIRGAGRRRRVVRSGFFDAFKNAFANEDPTGLKAIGDDEAAPSNFEMQRRLRAKDAAAAASLVGNWDVTLRVSGASMTDRSSDVGGPKVMITEKAKGDEVRFMMDLVEDGAAKVEATSFTTGDAGAWRQRGDEVAVTLPVSGYESGYTTAQATTTLFSVPAGNVTLVGNVALIGSAGLGQVKDGKIMLRLKSGVAGYVDKTAGSWTARQRPRDETPL
ncbi:hypothetical protein M885DRAFT_614454 [Pelagophyceae sp. CCMP2097]|nr:hypothetical protein M885DRAFT_614454 [Pelagophyceae sp. CCMP2097]|mmetsp:Transcript_20295/g.68785  ORF Transcript_20295/g.68785 Transcript_20295/m.68785 type:complete len:236 (-) Transcript_20295:576-1283(-)